MTQHHPRSLQALILDKKGERSYERLSRDCGGLPTRNALHRLVTSRMKAFPDRETLLGLQRGLPSTVDELLGACAISMGLKDDSADPDNLLIRGGGALPASSQQLLISLSAEMRRLAEESGGVAEAAPMYRAGESPATDLERRERSDEESSLPQATTSSREVRKGAVDMDEFKARRQRISTADEEDAGVPMPDVEKMPAYGVPQESILEREQQDADAEGSQLPPEED